MLDLRYVVAFSIVATGCAGSAGASDSVYTESRIESIAVDDRADAGGMAPAGDPTAPDTALATDDSFTNPLLTPQTVGVTNFHEVMSGVYRGAHPSERDLVALHKGGVRTIVSLQSMPWDTRDEEREARALGMTFINLEIPVFYTTGEAVKSAVRLLGDPSYHPLYVHCMHGEDRTGLVVGLHRVLNQKWTAKDGWAEMLKYDFHPKFFWYTDYYEKVTGFTSE